MRFTLLLAVLWIFISAIAISTAQDKFKKGKATDYGDLRYKTDNDFAQMLDQPWMKLKMLPGLKADTTPKPMHTPFAKVSDQDQQQYDEAVRESRPVKPTPPPPPVYQPEPEPVVKPPPVPPKPTTELLNFTFFATPVALRYDPDFKTGSYKKIDNGAISRFWQTMSQTDYDDFLTQAKHYQRSLKLNDWGYVLFLIDCGYNIQGRSSTYANLFAWFMLVKSGYDAKVGYDEGQVYLLLPSNYSWYEMPYFPIQGKYYFAASPANTDNVKTVQIYSGSYPGANQTIDIRLTESPELQRAVKAKTLTLKNAGEEAEITITYSQSIIDFYNRYPQSDLEIYLQAAVSPDVANSLAGELQPYIEGKSEVEAVNFLLNFVQTSFSYQTDGEQFGQEKFFFAEEAFHYQSCDCEDRSVLFAYLVKTLTDLDVVALDYPGHIAAAVRFSDDIPGDDVIWKGQRYVICDPTYIGALVGMRMPEYADTRPTVINI
ncbi:MAG: hypothetical protein ABIE92_03320 [bacterium]